jgi:hypothetical protein
MNYKFKSPTTKKVLTTRIQLSALTAFAWILPFCLLAQEGLDIKSVSIFKDQTAFFVKKGTVPASSGSWSIYGDTIPKALSGTFWLASPSNDFQIVKTYEKTIKSEKKAVVQDFSSMLALNEGKSVTLHFRDTTFSGNVLLMQVKPKKKPDMPDLNAPLLALQTTEGKTLIFTQAMIYSLIRLEFDENPDYIYDYVSSKKMPALQIDFKSKKGKQPLEMMYLSKGLAWKPDYKIDLIEENKARMSLRATVVNNAEDIKTDKLNLVAGVPNFRYATNISDLLNFLSISPTSNVSSFSNFAIPQNIRNESNLYGDFGGGASNITNNSNVNNLNDATAMEDLYFYTLKDIILKKGERAIFDIFNIDVPVEHIYETVLSDNNVSYSLQYSFINKTNPVIHTIKLTNNSTYTWTAASALVLKNDKNQNAPISQDKLGYTSQKDDISVKLTEAPDVSVKFLDKEINREVSKKSIKKGKYTYYHDLVTVETVVTIHNYKNKDIRLDLKRAITGELGKTDEKWQLAPRVQFGYTLNKKTDVCWEINLKAGAEKVITYSYSFYTTEHR